MSSESTFYTDGTNSNSFTTQQSSTLSVNNAAWRNGKFGDTGSTWSVTSGSSGSFILNTGAIGGYNSFASSYGWSIYTTYLRFDTSSLDDDEEITGAHLSLYTTAITDTAGLGFAQHIRVFAGLTGGSDRPTFSSPVANTTDFNWYCESAGGCTDVSSPFTCPINDGARQVGDIFSTSLSVGSRTSHQMTDSGNSLTDWVNRTGYTYIALVHGIWLGGSAADGNTYPCNNGVYTFLGTDYYLNPAPFTPTSGTETFGCTFAGRTSGNGPTLIINQGKTKFQMII